MTSDAVTTQASMRRLPAIAVVVRVLVVLDIVALLFAADLHVQGVHIALGSMVFEEPQIVPAAVVEGLAAGLYAVAAYTIFSGGRGAWRMTLAAHVFAILVLLLGVFARRAGITPFTQVSQLVMLGIFVLGLTLLLTPAAREPMRRGRRSS
jgi:hypothetical protein